MIPRYSMPEMSAVFADETRLGLWLEIELLAVEAWSKLGVVPLAHAAACRERAPKIDATFVRRVAEREALIDHDFAAFVDVVQESIGEPEGSWVHYGLTSSDVVDTALSATLVRAADLLLVAVGGLVSVTKRRAYELAAVPTVGRTHGMHAEPTTFGTKLALACLQTDRDRTRLLRAREAVSVGKLSGAVGTYSNIDPSVEQHVCDALGLRPVPATQVIARDRHAEYLYACAALGTTIEALRDRSQASATDRGRRGRGSVRNRPEGLVGNAAQTKPDNGRASHRSRAGAARLPRRGPRGRGPLA